MFELTWLSPTQHRQLRLAPGVYQVSSPTASRSDQQVAGRGEILIDDPWFDCPQMTLCLTSERHVKIENLGRPILLPSGRRINAGQSQTLATPLHLVIGKTRISLRSSETDWEYDQTLTVLTRDLESKSGSKREKGMSAAPSASTLVQWFDALNQLQSSMVGSQAFYDHAVQCTFDPAGLDLGMLLQRDADDWNILASHVPFPEFGFSFRRDLVERVWTTGKLWYHLGSDHFDATQYTDAQWVVAAPIRDQKNQVTSVLYAARFESSFNKRHGIRPLEAHFVRLVADAVSAATRRLEAQTEAARARVLLEQTFSAPVVQLLERDPQLLNSRQSEVTTLFIDLRGFSGLSEKLGATMTHQLLADLLNRWTVAVQSHQGVVIDYYGDGLAAFWNCPVAIAEHAWLACQTAWQMLDDLEIVNQNWSTRLPYPLNAGIGINTGLAQVGNSGSQGKLKYGPRGPEVNLASRLETATKRFGVPILLSETTAQQVQDRCLSLRLCRTQLPGIEQPQAIYQLLERHPNARSVQAAQLYAAALAAYEVGDLDQCLERLTSMLIEQDGDRRVDYLLEQLENHSHGQDLPGLVALQPKRSSLPKPLTNPTPFQAWQAENASLSSAKTASDYR